MNFRIVLFARFQCRSCSYVIEKKVESLCSQIFFCPRCRRNFVFDYDGEGYLERVEENQ